MAKIVHTIEDHEVGVIVRVFKNVEWDEYQIQGRINGRVVAEAFEDANDDGGLVAAKGTAQAMFAELCGQVADRASRTR